MEVIIDKVLYRIKEENKDEEQLTKIVEEMITKYIRYVFSTPQNNNYMIKSNCHINDCLVLQEVK